MIAKCEYENCIHNKDFSCKSKIIEMRTLLDRTNKHNLGKPIEFLWENLAFEQFQIIW